MTAVSDCCSVSTDGNEPVGACAPSRRLRAEVLPDAAGGRGAAPPRGLRLAAEEVEPDDLAGGVAVDQVAAERIDFQRDDRPGQPVRQRTFPAELITASSPSRVAAAIVRPGKSGTACETVPPR